MNAKQRARNRATAAHLAGVAKLARNARHTCEHCGQPGGHWVALPYTLEAVLRGDPAPGYYTCTPPCDHYWQVISDWYGDPEVINGTADCSFLRCRICDEEDHETPVSEYDDDEYDYDGYVA